MLPGIVEKLDCTLFYSCDNKDNTLGTGFLVSERIKPITPRIYILRMRGKFLNYSIVNPYPTAFPYGNGMVLHFYQQQEKSTTKTVHKVINKGLKTYV